MIKKIATINNLAVFKHFDWDSTVTNLDGAIANFDKLNIIYGRNYSGKTTLSRILRAFETGEFSDKFGRPSFTLQLDDGDFLTENDITSGRLPIRVYNDDFIRTHLGFIFDPDADLNAFAILGADNKRLLEEISNLENQIGSNEPDAETGLYADKKAAEAAYNTAVADYGKAAAALETQLRNKAIDRQSGIKYQTDLYDCVFR